MVRARLPFAALCGAALAVGFGGGGCSDDGIPSSTLGAATRIARADALTKTVLAPSKANGYSADAEGFASLGLRKSRSGVFTDLACALPSRANGSVVLGAGNVASFRMTLAPVGAREARGELDEGRVVYPSAFPEVDEIAVSSATASEFFYLLKSENAPHAFSWNVELPKSVATVERRLDGLWFLDAQHELVLRVPTAYAIDTAGRKTKADLAWNDEKRVLTVDLPKDASYTYPVLLDPAFETRVWSELKSPIDLAYPSLTYDAARHVSVLFSIDQTWTSDGSVWSAFVLPRGGVSPSTRYGGRLVYDEARKNAVLFGGTYGNRMFAETWLWSGTEWASARPTTSPAGRYLQAMAYDRARSEIVLFGGVTSNGILQDTWVWDGSTWASKTPATKPPARYDAGFAYDSVRQKAVLFGGFSPIGYVGDTWEWNGQDWRKLTLPESPSPRVGAQMAFDEARKQIVLYGGMGEQGISSETWSFDGTAWKRLTAALSPPPAYDASLAFDATRQRVFLYGGSLEDRSHNGTWSWDGRVWRQEQNGDLPEIPGDRTPLYANEAKQELQLFSGVDNIEDPKQSGWAFKGLAWSRRTFRTIPEKRRAPAMVWDEARQNAVLFGGAAEDRLLNDTWTFSGGWAPANPANAPSPRSQHRLAYHPSTNTVVLFGGSNDTGLLNDTWTWNGASWTARLVATPPPGRVRFGMGLHPASGNIVLFGGYDDQGVLNDTWTWNGATWKEERPAKIPETPFGTLILADDKECFLVQTKSLVWSWDGKDWALQSNVQTPDWDPNKWAAEGIYDPLHKNFLVLGTSKTFRGHPKEGFKEVGNQAAYGGVLAWAGKGPVRLSLDSSEDLDRADKTFVTVDEKKPDEWVPLAEFDVFPKSVAASTYDSTRKVGIVLGQDHQGSSWTWTWDGVSMQKKGSYGALGNLTELSLTFDAQRQQALVFGGLLNDSPSNTTFVLSGSDWVAVGTNVAPPPRLSANLAFDAVRGNVVLFGGFGGSALLGDTWTWNGTDWTEKKPATVPPARQNAALDFNPLTGTVILFGGTSEVGTLSDTWSWDGANWSQVVTKTPPSARAHHGLAYASTAKSSILFGGNSEKPGNIRFPWAFYSRGGTCSTNTDCATGSCVDGVCCETAACGTCQTCAGTDPGKCTAIVNAEDPDTCASVNHVSCNGTGVCGPSLGGGCKVGADCGSGLCIDGICCDSACDKPCESCRAAEKVSGRDDGRCGPATAGTNPGGKCAGEATCSASGVCSQSTGTTCRQGRYFENVGGSTKDCAPYKCVGQCLTRCSSANDCVFPFTCGLDGTCTAPKSPVEDAGGCSTRAPSHSSSDASYGALVLAALLLRARNASRRTKEARPRA